MINLLYILIGLAAGFLSGLMGIGGGILVVPALVLLGGFTQHTAQGTTLALLVLPIGILGAWQYYKHGEVNIAVALLLGLGFLIGSFLGAKCALGLNDLWLKRMFGGFLLLMGLKFVLTK